MFKAPFSFNGRIRRLEYGLTILLLIVISSFCLFLLSLIEDLNSSIALIIFLLLVFFMYWFQLAQGAKRCHDRGNSGFFQLIPFYNLWMLFAESEYGPNKYGLNPKGEGNETGFGIEEIGNDQSS